MSGYKLDYSMSNNAYDAYQDGEMPKSKWTKTAIVHSIEQALEDGVISGQEWTMDDIKQAPMSVLKSYLTKSSWHHTSSWYNATDFYSVDFDRLCLVPKDALYQKPSADESSSPASEVWKCTYLVWSGTRKHPKATEVTAVGTIRGNWLYLPDGSKKSITANGFRKIERVG